MRRALRHWTQILPRARLAEGDAALSRRRPEGGWCESLAFRLMSSDVVAAPKAAMASSRLLGKSAVITGAAKGIGRATAELFALEGARIVAGDRDADGLNRLCEHLESQGATIAAVVGDVSKPEDARNMVEAAVERYGRIDVLVANAGIIPLRNINEATPEDWDEVMAVDARGMFLCCKYAIEGML